MDIMTIFADKQRVICYANDEKRYRKTLFGGNQIRFVIS